MIVLPDYRGHRIEVNAVRADERYNAEVKSRRTLSQDKPHVDTVTCLKLTPDLAEHSGLIWARRWIDVQLSDGLGSARQ
jgi:hypothetical protein